MNPFLIPETHKVYRERRDAEKREAERRASESSYAWLLSGGVV